MCEHCGNLVEEDIEACLEMDCNSVDEIVNYSGDCGACQHQEEDIPFFDQDEIQQLLDQEEQQNQSLEEGERVMLDEDETLSASEEEGDEVEEEENQEDQRSETDQAR